MTDGPLGVGLWPPEGAALTGFVPLDTPWDVAPSPAGDVVYALVGERSLQIVPVVRAGEAWIPGEPLATFAGTAVPDYPWVSGGLAASATALYLADAGRHVIWSVDPVTGTATVLSGFSGEPGAADGRAAEARWHYPADLALHGDVLFVADAYNHRVRAIDLVTLEVTTVAGTGQPTCGAAEDTAVFPAHCPDVHDAGDGGPALEATLNTPMGLDVDPLGNLVVVDTYDQRVRVVHQ